MPEMAVQETHHLPADLQDRDVRVQAQPIETLDLERHMTLEPELTTRHEMTSLAARLDMGLRSSSYFGRRTMQEQLPARDSG